MEKWFEIDNISEVDTPSMVVYPERIKANIDILKSFVKSTDQLRPHVKTNKSAEVCKLLLNAGITKYKCATIAEAEMLAMAGAPDVLLAHQPVGPKAARLLELAMSFPKTKFSAIIDDVNSATWISETFENKDTQLPVFIDLNVGMNRTGIKPADAAELYTDCRNLKGIAIIGLHVYDGHLRDPDIAKRTADCDEAFKAVATLASNFKKASGKPITIVAGGSPTFPIHAKREDVECSPGTFIYWDTGYGNLLAEQPFLHAAVVVTRVISKPDAETICVDLGHKAIASENPLPNRVSFLNADVTPVGHSEEHLVLKIKKDSAIKTGDVLYGIPFHICPTVALHESVYVAENNHVSAMWSNISRRRKITH